MKLFYGNHPHPPTPAPRRGRRFFRSFLPTTWAKNCDYHAPAPLRGRELIKVRFFARWRAKNRKIKTLPRPGAGVGGWGNVRWGCHFLFGRPQHRTKAPWFNPGRSAGNVVRWAHRWRRAHLLVDNCGISGTLAGYGRSGPPAERSELPPGHLHQAQPGPR